MLLSRSSHSDTLRTRLCLMQKVVTFNKTFDSFIQNYPLGRACRPFPPFYLLSFLPSSLLPFFMSSFLPFFRTSYPQGSLTPLLAPARDTLWHSGLLGSYFFRCQFSYRFLMSFCLLFDHLKRQKLIQKRSKIASKIDPKTKRNIIWGIIRKS